MKLSARDSMLNYDNNQLTVGTGIHFGFVKKPQGSVEQTLYGSEP